MNIEIFPRKFVLKLFGFIGILLLLNIIGIIFKFYLHYDSDYVVGLTRLFDFDTERNVPTYYSALALVFSSLLLSVIAFSHKKDNSPYIYWLGLALIFFFLSFDEIAQIHERFDTPVRDLLHTSGFLFFAWVIPYGIAMLVLVILYFRFLLALPRSTLIWFITSGGIFISGAIGFESLGGKYAELHGKDTLVFSLFYTCEEFLEMLGIVVFIYALFMYIANEFESITFDVTKSE